MKDVTFSHAKIRDVEQDDKLMVLGAVCLEYYRNNNVALVSYLVVRPEYEQLGLGKLLLRESRPLCDAVCEIALSSLQHADSPTARVPIVCCHCCRDTFAQGLNIQCSLFHVVGE